MPVYRGYPRFDFAHRPEPVEGQGVPLTGDPDKVDSRLGAIRDLDPLAFSGGGVRGRRPVRWSETFNHPDIAVGDVAPYGEVAAVR